MHPYQKLCIALQPFIHSFMVERNDVTFRSYFTPLAKPNFSRVKVYKTHKTTGEYSPQQ